MGTILCIDTATDVCTVAIFKGKECIALKESGEDRSHATQLAVFIDEALKGAGLKVNELDAVAVSMGPGSYTGLRIGVSTAKGLCYGANIPLISVCTLKAMCYGVDEQINELTDFYFCPMLDARRMEVYTSVFDSAKEEVKPIAAEIIDENSFLDLLNDKTVIFFGNGAEKTKIHITHKNALFVDNYRHSARNMATVALEKFENKQFEDVAYFEPFYLKDFVATTPKKNILG